MKSIKILIFAGIFIIITSLICFTGRGEVYKKKIYYNSPEEVINVLNSKPLNAYEGREGSYFNLVNTDDFKECLSKRKRTTGSLMHFSTLNLSIEKDFNEEEIRNDYISRVQNLKDYKVSDNIKPYLLKGTYGTPYGQYGKINMYMVFIDEGEGYVIDYVKYSYDNNNNNIKVE